MVLAVFAISEPLLSPIGLGVTTKLAPRAYRAQTVAFYFFSVDLGTALSGVLAGHCSVDHEAAYFGINGAVVGLVMFALGPWISRRVEGAP